MGHRFTKTAANAPCCRTKNITNERITAEQPLLYLPINSSEVVLDPTFSEYKVDGEQQQCAGTCISVKDMNYESKTLNNFPDENLHFSIEENVCIPNHGQLGSPCSENKNTPITRTNDRHTKCIIFSENNMYAPTQRIVITIHMTKMEINTQSKNRKLTENLSLCEKNLTDQSGLSRTTSIKKQRKDIHIEANICKSNNPSNEKTQLINVAGKNKMLSISKPPTQSFLTLISSLLLSASNIMNKRIPSSSGSYRILLDPSTFIGVMDSILEMTEISKDGFCSKKNNIENSSKDITYYEKEHITKNRLLRFDDIVHSTIIETKNTKKNSTCCYHKLRSMFNDNQMLTSNFNKIMTILVANENFCNSNCCSAFKQILDNVFSRSLTSILTIYKIRLCRKSIKYFQSSQCQNNKEISVVKLPSSMRQCNTTLNKLPFAYNTNTGQLTINRVISDNLTAQSFAHIKPHVAVKCSDAMITNHTVLNNDRLKWKIKCLKEKDPNEISTPQLLLVQCAFINSSADVCDSTELQGNKISTVYIHTDPIDQNHFVSDTLVSMIANNEVNLNNSNFNIFDAKSDMPRINETTGTKTMQSTRQADALTFNKGASHAALSPVVHSQVDFSHYLVPDLQRIINASFYWGKMDRYEAERLLDGKPEGSFLLRDSAQEEFLFSVTFRKFGRSLHARIEQSGHRFSFDCHDPSVFTAPTIIGLLEHYKDPACVMFFEPMLTIPLHRKSCFSLEELCRATIVSHTTYDGINKLELPVRIKSYLKEYHYKQKLRVKPFDDSFYDLFT